MKKLLSIFLSIVMVVTTVAIVPITAFAGHRCPICDEWIDGDPYCEECYMCGDCAETFGGFCEGCQAMCIMCADGQFCEECHQCMNCVEICDECGGHCYDCNPGCEECGRCGHCLDGDGVELCEECQAICIECANGSFCRDCLRCLNCVQLCEKCDGYCIECSEGCEDCGRCGNCLDSDGVRVCESCGLCEDCVGELCEECGRCHDCAPEFCESCGEVCADCRSICGNCGVCSDCNGDTICGICGNACAECTRICEECNACENCATICENGDHCNECSHICGNCGLCEECTVICEACGDYCSDCADYFCEDCGRCGECVDICHGCGICHECIGGSFCENCGTCSNCATICEYKDFCSACSKVCQECGMCSFCCSEVYGSTICSKCNICTDHDYRRVCAACSKCENCTTFTPTKFNGRDDYNAICDECIGDYPDADDLTIDFGDMIIGQPINRKPTFSGKSAKYIDHTEYVSWYKRDSNGKVTPCVYNAVFEPGYEYCFDFVISFKSGVNLNYKLVSDFNAIGFEVVADNVEVYGSNDGNYPYCEISCKYKYAKYPEYDKDSLYTVVTDSFYVSARDVTAVTVRIASGKIHSNDTVVIITPDGTVKKVKALYMEMFRKQLDEAIKGDNCAIAFARSDISPDEIPVGSVILADNGTILPFTPAGAKISGAFAMHDVTGTTVESISSGSTVNISNGTGYSYTGTIYSSDGSDFKNSSEVEAILVVDSPIPVYNSQELGITYGSQYIGDFKVDTLVKATDFNITKREYTCSIPDAQVKIEAEFTPANATYGVKWESLNPDIATVDSLGNVKSHTAGTAIIRASLGDKVIDCVVHINCNHFFRYRHDGKDSTCTEHGYTEYYSCQYCYVTRGKEELPLKPHEYELVSETAPTCAKAGKKVYTCIACGDTMTESIAKLPHTPEVIPAKAPTCSATGLTEGKKCSVCGEIITAQKTVAKKAHTTKTTVTKATLSKDGKSVTKCTVCGTTTSTKAIAYPKTFTLSATSYTYDGKVKKPSVTVKDSKGNKIAASNYTVTYSNNKNVGKATVKITFKGNYSGTKSLTFKINPKNTSISSITATSKAFTVKWKKQATQTTGYQIQYSMDKNFKKGNKTVAVGSSKTVSKKITKLTGKKKYYVRIRTYKTVSGAKYYSAWSKAKVVTTKK